MSWKQTLGGTAAFLLLSAGAAAAYPATVTGNLNMRSGPGTGYGVIDTLPPGTVVDVRGCTGSWCDIGSGWVSSSYLARGGYAAPPAVVAPAPVVSFYIGSSPYYWNDDGYYWYYRSGRRYRVDNDWVYRHRSGVRWHNSRDRDRYDRWRGRDRDRHSSHDRDRGKNHGKSSHSSRRDNDRSSSRSRNSKSSFVGAKSGAKQKRLER